MNTILREVFFKKNNASIIGFGLLIFFISTFFFFVHTDVVSAQTCGWTEIDRTYTPDPSCEGFIGSGPPRPPSTACTITNNGAFGDWAGCKNDSMLEVSYQCECTGFPDLLSANTGPAANASYTTAQSIPFTGTVTNQSTAAIVQGGWAGLEIDFDRNGGPLTDGSTGYDDYLDLPQQGAFSASQSKTLSWTTSPGNLPAGNHRYRWNVDSVNELAESNESNNRSAWVNFVVTAPPVYTYNFNLNGGAPFYPSVNGVAGSVVASPGTPTRSGYTFNGWLPSLPTTMPVGGGSSGAQWTITPAIPTVIIPTHANVTQTSATLGATVFSAGSSAITSRGTCWGTTINPITNCTAEGGTAVSAFTHARSGFSAGTTYYYRGYATNAVGTGYSADSSFVTIASTYSCTGSNPANVNLCAGDDTGLSADTPRTVVPSCTATKCEYTCNAGYTYSAGACVPTTYSCIGAVPSNATLCPLDDVSLGANTPRTVVPACTATKCEYTCNNGYVIVGSSCVAPPTLTATPPIVNQGSQTTLTWTLSGQTCTLNGGTYNNVSLSADGSFTPVINANTTFTLTCPSGTVTARVEIIPSGFET